MIYHRAARRLSLGIESQLFEYAADDRDMIARLLKVFLPSPSALD